MDVKMFPATVLRVGEVNGPAKAWLVSLLGSAATDDAEVRISLKPSSTVDEWSPQKNDRRIVLIDRKIDRSITPDERLELELLQEEMLDHVEKVAPIPLGHARQMYQRLVETAGANGSA